MLAIIKEFWAFIRVRKRYWLLPVLFFLLLLAAFSLVAGGSAIAPFIYTLF